MSIKMIVHENVPCWYELSWKANPPAIILRIHKDFIESKSKINLEKAPIVEGLARELGLSAFGGNFSKDIGFGDIFKRTGEKDGFTEFVAEIPKVKKKTDKKCHDCAGTGKRKWGNQDEECLFCEGSGQEWTMDWKEATAISASFTVLTVWLKYCEIETSASFPQLLTVQTITQGGPHGGSLSGDISIPLRNWLDFCSRLDCYTMPNIRTERKCPKIIEAMTIAYDQMIGLRDYQREFSFNAYVTEGGRFIANCPGDACGLHPSDWYDNKGQGFEFSCHNVDSPMQQITLIAALAVLHDIARKKIK